MRETPAKFPRLGNIQTDPSPGQEPIRLALCITELNQGGAERCLAELAIRIDKRRFTPVVYSLAPRPEASQPSVVPSLEAAGIEVHHLGARHRWQVAATVLKLAGLFRRQRPRIVQTFLFHANLVGRLAAKRAGVPLVISGIRVAERRGRWRLRLDQATAGLVDRHVCVSESVKRFSAEEGGLPPDRLVVIPNGIDAAKYPSACPADLAALGVPRGQHVITFVGRLDAQKRVAWLLELSPRWLERLPQHDLLLVGEGPERRMLESTAMRLGIADRVHFAGWRGDVPEILAASSLLVLPSAWEGMPNVILEAMASRLSIVATAVEGVQELLGPVADAQTVDLHDAAGFADRVVELASNKQLANDLGLQNRVLAKCTFSVEEMIRSYEWLYETRFESTSD